MASTLRTYKIGGRKARLHPECVDGFRCDRRHGLIYGPYMIIGEDGSRHLAKDAEQASVECEFCPYCNGR